MFDVKNLTEPVSGDTDQCITDAEDVFLRGNRDHADYSR